MAQPKFVRVDDAGKITTPGVVQQMTDIAKANGVPTGGTTGQVLQRSSTGAATWGNAPSGLPAGGTAGQAVVKLIDPASLWVDTRFDQISAEGLAAGLPAKITLRSRRSQSEAGRVLRVEPRADAVTEENLAKIVFETPPTPLPPLGELAEITVQLGEVPAAPIIHNAAIRTVNGQRGVWKLVGGDLAFAPIKLGRSNLDGMVQVSKGLAAGDRIVVYSEKTLNEKSRIRVVERITGATP